jgi:hypothetical protein
MSCNMRDFSVRRFWLRLLEGGTAVEVSGSIFIINLVLVLVLLISGGSPEVAGA